MKKQGALLTLAALVAVLLVAYVGHGMLAARQGQGSQSTDGSGQASAGESALMLADYDATVYTETGEALSLTQIADGRPLVINFWATWCPYCVDELPDFQKIHAEYGDRVSFAFLDVADGERERVEDAAAWLVEQGYDDLPAYYDSSLEASTVFGAYSLPTTALVNAEGEILSVQAGRIDASLLRGALETLV